MPLKAVLIDLSKTLVDSDGRIVPGMPEAIRRFRNAGLKVAIVTNDPQADARLALIEAGISVNLIVGRDTVRVKKPSPKFCQYPAQQFGVKTHEMVYIGDDDNTDALAAVNAGVLYLAARWANPDPHYGFPCNNPDSAVRFVTRFLMDDPVWYWRLKRDDRIGREVDVLGLLQATRGPHHLKSVLKSGSDPQVNGLGLRGFFFRRLLTALYLGGHLEDVDYWTWYPSHNGQPKTKHERFLLEASRLFKDRYIPGLLRRHTVATKAAFARFNGQGDPGFLNQMNTVCLNPDAVPKINIRARIESKRILVVDDFATEGHSFECARNLLFQGGADSVLCVCFGRYHDDYQIQTPRSGLDFDPWAPRTFEARDYRSETVQGRRNLTAEQEVERLMTLDIPVLRPTRAP